MPARLAQLMAVGLLAAAAGSRAGEGEPSVKLTGIGHFNGLSRALIEIQTRPGWFKFQDADMARVLAVDATLLGRKPLPVDRTTLAVKLTIRTQTALTRAEAIAALDTIAALNRLQFVLMGDDGVKVLPAAPIRRETNSIQ
jgi:hypothetical protein